MNNDPNFYIGIAAIVLIVIFLIAIPIIWYINHNPYIYPYYTLDIDVSRKRNVTLENEIEKYILAYGFSAFKQHQQHILSWEKQVEENISHSLFKQKRTQQYIDVKDTSCAYHITLKRQQTRYSQTNYVRTPYTIYMTSDEQYYSYDELVNYYKRLKSIDFEATTKDYHAKNQRQLMTPKLRKLIKKRDEYTCQICGKYMRDSVGLHIDHIQPISKGGKTVTSNLQVLCSKCNGKKSNN